MTANPASTPIPASAVVATPRLGRGVRWSDVTREIELDELDRQARAAECTPNPTPSLGETGSSLGVAAEAPDQTILVELGAQLDEEDFAAALQPAPPSRRGWLRAAIHRRFG